MSQNVSKMNPKVLKPFKVTSTLILPLPCFSCKNHNLLFNQFSFQYMYMHTLLRCKGGHWNIILGGYLLDLRDTDKSWYFGIIEFNNNIVLSFGHWVSFFMSICHFAIFMPKWSQEGEKRCFIYSWADYYLQANTIRWHVHTIICRQLFAGHVVDSLPMKRKKNLHRMIIMSFIYFQIKVSTKVQGFNLHSYQCFISYGSGVLCLLFSILHG